MSLGKGIFENGVYKFPVLGNNFYIKNINEKFIIFHPTSNGTTLVMKKCNSLKESKEYLVNWINKNMRVTYPGLTM